MARDTDLGFIAVVDLHTGCVVGGMESFVPLTTARMALSRPPDVEDDLIVSWGSVSRDEFASMLSYEPDPAERSNLQAEVDALIEHATGRCVTLYYAERYGEQ